MAIAWLLLLPCAAVRPISCEFACKLLAMLRLEPLDFFEYLNQGRTRMAATLKYGGLLLAACLTIGEPAWGQSSALSITLTGQSMIRSDIRAHAPSAVPIIASLLKGDVVFTNFEATIVDERKGQSRKDGRFLSPPEALDALKTFGFNLVSLSNNHSLDLKVPGIQNTLEQASRLNLAHAGTGNTIDEAVAPGYLQTPKGTVALVAMASGLVAGGRIGHRNAAGRE